MESKKIEDYINKHKRAIGDPCAMDFGIDIFYVRTAINLVRQEILSTHVSEEKAVEAFCKICQEDNGCCPSEENLAAEINCHSMKQFLAALKAEKQ